MFSPKKSIDPAELAQLISERAAAHGIPQETLLQELNGQPLHELLCTLVTDVLEQTEAERRADLLARQKKGREETAAHGGSLGRPRKQRSDKKFARLYADYEAGIITAEEAAERLHVSVSTFYRWLREARRAEGQQPE
ncbi:MAG: recombinase family protein [Butyricicoccus sp.]|nr:recombinase family protein [Butyricicoccus sp.]